MLYQFLLVLNDSKIQTFWNRNSGRDSSTTSNMYIHFLIKNPILISESLTFIQCIHILLPWNRLNLNLYGKLYSSCSLNLAYQIHGLSLHKHMINTRALYTGLGKYNSFWEKPESGFPTSQTGELNPVYLKFGRLHCHGYPSIYHLSSYNYKESSSSIGSQ